MGNKVKIAPEMFRVIKEDTKERIIFEQYLDENDHAYIAELAPEKVVFKFDNSCKMFNMKGTLVGIIRLEDIKGEKWAFYTAEIIDDRISTTFAFNMKAKYPYGGEPEVIKWLIETNQYEAFKDK